MFTLRDFLAISMDDYYKINIYFIDENKEILHQTEVSDIEEELEKIGKEDLLDYYIASWDINEEHNNEFTINI